MDIPKWLSDALLNDWTNVNEQQDLNTFVINKAVQNGSTKKYGKQLTSKAKNWIIKQFKDNGKNFSIYNRELKQEFYEINKRFERIKQIIELVDACNTSPKNDMTISSDKNIKSESRTIYNNEDSNIVDDTVNSKKGKRKKKVSFALDSNSEYNKINETSDRDMDKRDKDKRDIDKRDKDKIPIIPALVIDGEAKLITSTTMLSPIIKRSTRKTFTIPNDYLKRKSSISSSSMQISPSKIISSNILVDSLPSCLSSSQSPSTSLSISPANLEQRSISINSVSKPPSPESSHSSHSSTSQISTTLGQSFSSTTSSNLSHELSPPSQSSTLTSSITIASIHESSTPLISVQQSPPSTRSQSLSSTKSSTSSSTRSSTASQSPPQLTTQGTKRRLIRCDQKKTRKQKSKENWLTFTGPYLQFKKSKIHAHDECAGCTIIKNNNSNNKNINEVFNYVTIVPNLENYNKACKFCFEL